jgi:hypothetical protein
LVFCFSDGSQLPAEPSRKRKAPTLTETDLMEKGYEKLQELEDWNEIKVRGIVRVFLLSHSTWIVPSMWPSYWLFPGMLALHPKRNVCGYGKEMHRDYCSSLFDLHHLSFPTQLDWGIHAMNILGLHHFPKKSFSWMAVKEQKGRAIAALRSRYPCLTEECDWGLT